MGYFSARCQTTSGHASASTEDESYARDRYQACRDGNWLTGTVTHASLVNPSGTLLLQYPTPIPWPKPPTTPQPRRVLSTAAKVGIAFGALGVLYMAVR